MAESSSSGTNSSGASAESAETGSSAAAAADVTASSAEAAPVQRRSGVAVWRIPVLIAIAVVIGDQLSKHWAVTDLGRDRVIEIVWTLQFNLAFNSGMAFSRGEGLGPVIAVVATIVIVWLLVSLRTETGRLSTFGMGLVIGGAAGNLVDRLLRGDAWLRGAVVDFIDFQWFPIFNVADIAINVGAGLLILNAVLVSRRAKVDFATARTDAAAADAAKNAATDNGSDTATVRGAEP